MSTKPATITLGISARIGGKNNTSNNHSNTASFTARPAHITQASPTVAKRGHIRSASLENGNSFTAKNTLGLPVATAREQQQQQQPTIMSHTGTLKSRNEQKRMRGQKFGSHSSLDQDALPSAGRTKFQNIRQIFEITKKRTFGGGSSSSGGSSGGATAAAGEADKMTASTNSVNSYKAQAHSGTESIENQRLHAQPPATTTATTHGVIPSAAPPALMSTSMPSLQLRQQTQAASASYQPHQQLVRKPTPTLTMMGANGSGNRSSYSEMSERLSITESVGGGSSSCMSGNFVNMTGNALDAKQKLRLQQQLQQQQQLVQQQQQQLQQQQHLQAQRQHSQPAMGQLAHLHQHQQQQQQHMQQQLQQQQLLAQQRSSGGISHQQHSSIAATTTMNGSVSAGETGVEQSKQSKPSTALATTTTTAATGTTSATTAATAAPAMSVMTSYENLLRPIAFKPIPFEPDYSLQNARYIAGDVNAVTTTTSTASSTNVQTSVVGDRYGSTPSLAAAQGSNQMRFGSTSDLRHGSAGGVGGGVIGGINGVGAGGGGGALGGIAVGAYSSNNYCNSLMARRRGSRSLKINDSMESIRHTPDSDANSQSSTIKSTGSSAHHNNNNSGSNSNGLPSAMHNGTTGFGFIGVGSTAGSGSGASTGSNGCGGSASNGCGKYLLSEQCDMTPSPSDSGISDLEAALKDRDSELSYLRQAMEHNEKVIFRVQKDKENFWEQETKRLKTFYEAQQREYLLKMKKMEQMLAMQQFQFKQHKLRHTEQSNKLREQVADLKNENEILRSTNGSLKNSERNLKDSVAYIEEQLRESENTIASIKAELEESEWKVCERNGELALLKSQLKEANVEITLKEHAIVHLRHENTNAETQIYESLQENQKMTKQKKQVEQQQARTDKQAESELKQLNKIIILKDQVILALTNELAKLRKELSDLAIFQEYGEEPSGRFIRLKQQLDNLTDICNRTRRQAHKPEITAVNSAKEKVIDDTNLELIMNCLKIAPPLDDTDESENERERAQNKQRAEKRLAKMSADIQNFVYGAQNLPDIAMNHQPPHKPLKYTHSNPHKLEESTLDTLIEESASYAEEIAKLRKQLDDVRVNFELEKRQWCEEREKVLNYQKQLQAHYINMYQKLRSLESGNEV
ncbi:uncharacterized protein DDB_G0283357 isoform X2 [Zeugodacus cucurbitae]|uniref:uncharacterized protein DDB_G0283357 isoform X2 n=1 Tax=Zeugodacus cucurbitae TaxID=28588 RepID=UPI0023D94B2E|nr:uncharacterized protein DDB_G0283357 isoform X2 [Zeugodacus cucurbitae]